MVLPFIKISIAIRSIFLATLFINCHDIAATSQPPAPQGFAVVELFTSEGCSSCPPADAAMSVIANKYKEQVFVLGFHVDYWNRLGWKDEFSSSDYSKRQRNYATAFSLEGVYTPQVVVNGKSQFVGSDKSKIEKVIQSQLNEKAATTIELNASAGDHNTVKINYTINGDKNSNINIALIQLQAQSNIKRGENNGLTLHHINIVRDFKTIDVLKDKTSTAILTMPAGLTTKECKVIAFVQDKRDLHITAAADAAIN